MPKQPKRSKSALAQPPQRQTGSSPSASTTTTTPLAVTPSTAAHKVADTARLTAYLLLAGISAAVSQLSLSPVYGSIPASLHHQRLVTAIFAAAALLSPSVLGRPHPDRAALDLMHLLPVLAYWVPAAHFFLFPLSRHWGPVHGPILTELATLAPTLLLSVAAAGRIFERAFDLPFARLPAVAAFFAVSSTAKLAGAVLPSYMGTHDFLTRSGLQLLLGSAHAFLAPTRLLLFAVPGMLHALLANPHVRGEKGLAVADTALRRAHNFTLLARHESVTGYVSVLEGLSDGLRVLRCDHSLLGGHWLLNEERRAAGLTGPESIYAVFTMLEAVRLVEPASSSLPSSSSSTSESPAARARPRRGDTDKSALVIGLGIGTAPAALIAHGVATTIVELDPVVHAFATRFFGLPANHTAAITDAAAFVSAAAAYPPYPKYDFVVHDVFTGGAEPAALFTLEFLRGLRALLRDDDNDGGPGGVVAINYAGDLALPSTRLVLNTAHAVFPSCRIFRDSEARAPWEEADGQREGERGSAGAAGEGVDFINMVVFCTTRAGGFRFREAEERDFLGSYSRRANLRPREALEVAFMPDEGVAELRAAWEAEVRAAGVREASGVDDWAGEGWEGGEAEGAEGAEKVEVKPEDVPVLTKANVGVLDAQQRKGAVSHWKIMRTVLPDGVWETW